MAPASRGERTRERWLALALVVAACGGSGSVDPGAASDAVAGGADAMADRCSIPGCVAPTGDAAAPLDGTAPADGSPDGLPERLPDAASDARADAPTTPLTTTVCALAAGVVSFAYSDPAVPGTWTGTNGTFTDACDGSGNLTKYSCEAQQTCGPGPNPGCTQFDTGVVKSWSIDCAGHCGAAACPSRCPAFGDAMTVQAVDASGNVTLQDAVDGRTFACQLSYDQPSDGFDCIAGVHVGLRGTFSSQGFSGTYCTGSNVGSLGLCYPGATTCNGQNCTYGPCGVVR